MRGWTLLLPFHFPPPRPLPALRPRGASCAPESTRSRPNSTPCDGGHSLKSKKDYGPLSAVLRSFLAQIARPRFFDFFGVRCAGEHEASRPGNFCGSGARLVCGWGRALAMTHDALEKTADPAALIIASAVAIAGALGAWERIGLSADSVAELLAGLLAMAAALRMAWRKRHG